MDFEPEGYPLCDYIEVNEEKIKFPDSLHIAYAVCSKQCGNAEFIVDGSSQVCQRCGKLMFRTFVRKYELSENVEMQKNDSI